MVIVTIVLKIDLSNLLQHCEIAWLEHGVNQLTLGS